MKIIYSLFLLLFLIVVVVFASLNANLVNIHYLFGSAALPLCLLLISFFIIGLIVGFSLGFWLYLKQKRQNWHLQKSLQLVEKERHNLRVSPYQENL